MARFHVIKDTREKQGHGWWFDESSYCSGTTKAKLNIGDYTIKDMEHILCIERKESVTEFAGNCTEKRFHKELDAMSTFQYKFLIFEFGWSDIERYPAGSGIPPAKWKSIRIKGNYMMRVISSIMIEHGISVIAAGDAPTAEKIAFRIMRKVYELQV